MSMFHATPKGTLQPNVYALVAVCEDWGIGFHGGLLVRNSADMRHFKELTWDHTVLMGRKTLESFPGSRPLPHRRNIVLTQSQELAERSDIEVAPTLEEALALAGTDLTWVIGGGATYRALLPYCSKAIVTINHCVRPADTFFPNLDDAPQWCARQRITTDEHGDTLTTSEGVVFEYVTYEQTAMD